jgi:hypothetical protein
MIKVNGKDGILRCSGSAEELAADAGLVLTMAIKRAMCEDSKLSVRDLIRAVLMTAGDCFDGDYVRKEIEEGAWLVIGLDAEAIKEETENREGEGD